MAATGYTPIYLYYSGTPTNVPLAANLGAGELAINAADGNLFYKNTSNAVVTIPVLQSSATQSGWLSSTDWSTFNSKQPAGAYLTSVTSDAPLTGAGTSASHLSMPAASGSVNGYLTSTDWTTFNSKQPAGTYVTSVSGTAPVVSSGGTTPAISMAAATSSVNGYLTSTDWTTFNSKAPAFTYTTGYIPFGQGTTTPTQSSNLFWDNSNKRLGIGTSSPALILDAPFSSAGDGFRVYNTLASGFADVRVGNDANANLGILRVGGSTQGGIYQNTLTIATGGGYNIQIAPQAVLNTSFFPSGGVSIGNTTDPGATNLSVTGDTITGSLFIGTTSAYVGSRVRVKSTGASNATYNTELENSAGTVLFAVRDDGYMFTGQAAVSPYNVTTGSAANCYINSDGGLYRSTSSLKYKKNVEDAVHGLADVLKLRSVTYQGNGKVDIDKTFGGLIAEEVDALGLKEFVQYAEDGTPDSIYYGNMIGLLAKSIQELHAMVVSQQDEINQLKGTQ